ncbi:hypothetical protein TRFO_35177 [Tritrichomonas foetus]|uniref:Ubiquitin-like domain-containing protein n=1 Tax=Tritrichomonas foetus TaxID=1144522 RepID=A0A1J4JLJ4_9EUKA|nr:hypothetical protein TRFO_35177 [Tritrichomonas foetus]|eukprot:OHS98435.1 hypothetical protein TRFO_35177 [Tritrichomonas foetus]
MNAKLLNTPEDKLQDHILRESDVIFVVPMPEKVPPAHTFIYCSLGNDLLMQLTVKDESSVSDLKNLIESRYKIPSENQLIYWHGSPVDDSRTIDTFAPDDTFVLLSLELTGKLNVIFENGGKKIKKKFSAYSTVGEIKTVLFQSYNDANKNNNAKEEDNENDDNSNSQQKIIHDNKSLAFEGMMCDDNDALFSFCRLEPRFTLNGVEDQISIDKVNNMIRAKAEANDYCYLYIYAKMLFFGIVIPQDKVLAAQYFEKAYEQGHYTAMTDYAELIYNGELPEPRPDAAMKYSKRAADNGHIGATYLYGILCLKQRKFAEAQQYLNKATNQGHILAATAYAQMILKGQSEVTDKTVAQDLLVNAAKKKYPPAMKALAKLMKFEGNIEGADKLMQEAASLGSPGALYYLANQVLIKNDFKKAAKYAQEASKYGHTGAKRLLGIMQRRGTGVDKNIEEAFKLLTEASEKGDTQATFHLAKMYLRGDGCEVDKEKAYELVSKAASDGHKSSIFFIYIFIFYLNVI